MLARTYRIGFCNNYVRRRKGMLGIGKLICHHHQQCGLIINNFTAVTTNLPGHANYHNNHQKQIKHNNHNSEEKQQTLIDILSFTEFDQWTSHQVASILCTRKRRIISKQKQVNDIRTDREDDEELILFNEGGVGLWSFHVKPLFDEGFCGADLLSIRQNIEKEGMKFACSELRKKLRRNDENDLLEEEYCREIVTWVEEYLREPEESMIEISLVDFEELEQSIEYVIHRVMNGVDSVKGFTELKMSEEMAFKTENEKLKQNLGPLFKNPWPFTTGGLDWRFYPVLVESFQERNSENEIKSIHQSLQEKIKNNDRKGQMYILSSPHASGKSFSISHLACTNTAFLFSVELGKANDAILTLLSSFIEIESSNGKKQTRHTSTELLYMIYNSQLLLIHSLLQKQQNYSNQNVTPLNWWIYLNSTAGRQDFNKVFKQLLEYELSNTNFESFKLFKYLQRSIREKIGTKTLLFTIDDMEVIETLTSKGQVKSKLNPATVAGKVFNSILSYPHNSVIVSGANISHRSIGHLTGELKRDCYQIVSGYGVINSAEVYNFIEKLLNVKKIIPDSYIQILASLAKGRRGILFEWLETVAKIASLYDSNQNSKEKLEEWAIRTLTTSLEKVLFNYSSKYSRNCMESHLDDHLINNNVSTTRDVVIQNLSLRGFINVDESSHQLVSLRTNNEITTCRSILRNFITENELACAIPSSFTEDSSQLLYKIPEPLLMYSLNKTLNLEDLIQASNRWLKRVLKQRSDTNERGLAIEIVCGLLMAKIAKELNGKPLSEHVLFKSHHQHDGESLLESNNFLTHFTLHPNISLIHCEDIWKVLIGSRKYGDTYQLFREFDMTTLYATGLDINLRWDGLMLGKPIASEKPSPPLIITFGAKMINSSIHPEQFLMNLQSTSISNGFLTKDLKRVQPKCEQDRQFLTSVLNCNHSQDICNLRILFDYTADISHFERLNAKEKIPLDIEPRIRSKVVVWSRNNPTFKQWFKESLPETFEIFERYWTRYCYTK